MIGPEELGFGERGDSVADVVLGILWNWRRGSRIRDLNMEISGKVCLMPNPAESILAKRSQLISSAFEKAGKAVAHITPEEEEAALNGQEE